MNAKPTISGPNEERYASGLQAQREQHTGDEEPPGTPQTGEAISPQCGDSGRQEEKTCANCGGTGKVIVTIGDA